jgi:dienelactone hydrolase
MDVYYPPMPTTGQPPTVLLPMAYPDPTGGVRSFGPVTSWARLIAASGMAAVIYGAEVPDEDVHAVLRHLRSDSEALGVDAERLGLFATSAHVTVALSVLMRDTRVKCAALLYGYTLDMDGSTTVADMGRQYGFVNACAGKSVDDVPDTVPILLVRAGRDQFPGLNQALDKIIARALVRNLPVSLINHPTGAHAFDMDENTPMSRAIVQQVLRFLVVHLKADE